MKKGLKEIGKGDWEFKGATLARADHHEQTAFLKAFVKECNSWGTNLQVQSQLAWVNNELSKEEKEILSMITFSE